MLMANKRGLKDHSTKKGHTVTTLERKVGSV